MGKNGITEGVKVALDQALTARELVKAREWPGGRPCLFFPQEVADGSVLPQVKVGENSDDSEDDVAEVLAGDVKAEVRALQSVATRLLPWITRRRTT